MAPIRPGSPLGRIKRTRQQPGEGSEEKSGDSASLVQRKRKRSAEKIVAGGDEEEIIDMTLGREHELPQVATSQPSKEGERDHNSLNDDENLNKFMAGLDSIVLLDDEVQEVAPPTDTPEEVGAEKTESGPVASPPTKKRTLKKKADEKEAESTEVATGKELIVAPQQPVAKKDLGRVTRSKKCEVEKKKTLPSLDLPTTLLPTDHPDHTTYAPPKRSILPSDSMLLSTNGDKAERHQMRVQWARETMTEKDKDLAEHLSDVQLRQWITQAAAHVR
ncbi:hypothetical protein Dimus_037853 [Dionaea muscipula]